MEETKIYKIIKDSVTGRLPDEAGIETMIPSPEVRDLMLQEGRELNDLEKAVLIAEAGLPLEEEMHYLKIIRGSTEDSRLRESITGYLAYRECEAEHVINSDEGVVYSLRIDSGSGQDDTLYGFFEDYLEALRYGEKSRRAFRIQKYPVLGSPVHRTLTDDELGAKPLMQWKHAYDGSYCGEISYYSNGSIASVFSGEVKKEIREYFLNVGYGEDFLQDTYVSLPNPFDIGDIVSVIGVDDYTGVFNMSKEDWEAMDKDILTGAAEDRGLKMGYGDAAVRLECVSEDGSVWHTHQNIAKLTRINSHRLSKLPQAKLLEAISYLLKGHFIMDEFIMSYEKCRKTGR